ncbi:hypothetical protein DL98DRAFT_591158 [Cadophora sp. DSE1049]|nr:hypothetical protein DL98DRAFT_591158 [Cadophora sp. DSE1049]
MVWGVSRKSSPNSDSQAASDQTTQEENSSTAVPDSPNMNSSAHSVFGTHNHQHSSAEAPPAYSHGATEFPEEKPGGEEEDLPIPEETTGEKVEKLLCEKEQLLANEDEEKYAVDEAWLERCEAWNRFQESCMTKEKTSTTGQQLRGNSFEMSGKGLV